MSNTTTTWTHPLDYVRGRRWTRVEDAGPLLRVAAERPAAGRPPPDLTARVGLRLPPAGVARRLPPAERPSRRRGRGPFRQIAIASSGEPLRLVELAGRDSTWPRPRYRASMPRGPSGGRPYDG